MATASYERDFVSCEDDLTQIAGVFNFACTITGMLIMAVPFRLWNIYHQNHHRHTTPALIISTNKNVYYKITEEQIFILFLGLTFALNVTEHATGFLGPPCIEMFGTASNLWLAVLLCRVQQYPKIEWIRGVAVFLTILSFSIGFVSIPCEILLFHCISPVVNIYVVSTMGYLCYHESSTTAREHYIQAVIAFLIFGVSLPIESSWCNLWENLDESYSFADVAARMYHSVFLHALVPYLLHNVTMCALALSSNETASSKLSKHIN